MLNTADQVQKGGLAGAGLPHDGDHFTRCNGKADVIHGVDILIALPEHLGQIFTVTAFIGKSPFCMVIADEVRA